MKTRDAAIGQWAKILDFYGLPPITGKRHFKGKCPICGSKGKYRCDDMEGRGTFICTCNRGDGWKLLSLTQNKEIKDLMTEVDEIIGNTYESDRSQLAPVKSDISKTRERVISMFSRMTTLARTDGEKYLNNRGIYEMPPEAVRYCASQKATNGTEHQAIWSLATDDKANLCYLHRTLLDGDKKASVPASKKLTSLQEENVLKYAESVAIRMFPPATTLGIAEGIETALSCKKIYGVNTWSVINSGFMAKFRVPLGVKHLIIFADMDPHSATGHAAAFACAHANLVAKNDLEKVSIRWPDQGDFNDMMLTCCEVREQPFTKKVAA